MKTKAILITLAALVVVGLVSVLAFSTPCDHVGEKEVAAIEKTDCCKSAAVADSCKKACDHDKKACCEKKTDATAAKCCDKKHAENKSDAKCCDSQKKKQCSDEEKKKCSGHKH